MAAACTIMTTRCLSTPARITALLLRLLCAHTRAPVSALTYGGQVSGWLQDASGMDEDLARYGEDELIINALKVAGGDLWLTTRDLEVIPFQTRACVAVLSLRARACGLGG